MAAAAKDQQKQTQANTDAGKHSRLQLPLSLQSIWKVK